MGKGNKPERLGETGRCMHRTVQRMFGGELFDGAVTKYDAEEGYFATLLALPLFLAHTSRLAADLSIAQ